MLIDRRRLAINPRSTARSIAVGTEPHQAALVVDDFYVDPEYVRDIALALDYADTRGTYPGFEARVSIDPSGLLARVRELIDPALEISKNYRTSFVFSLMDERVSASLRHYPHPHADNVGEGIACLAGMVYLNPPSQCRGGTGFYRHRETGVAEDRGEISPGLAAYMVEHGLTTVREAYNQIIRVSPEQEAAIAAATTEWGYLCDSNATWELVELVEMKFNRFIVFDSYLFHHPYIKSGQFGHTQDMRRLTQTIFFEVPGVPAA